LANAEAEVRQASLVENDSESIAATPAVGLSRDDRFRRAIQLSEYLKATRPALYAEPAVRFAEVAAQRQLGFANPAKRYHLTLGQLPASDPWRQCAETEEWLATPAELPPPKKFGACRPAHEPPHLDGRLDEPLWAAADRLRLHGADDVAHDRQGAGVGEQAVGSVPLAPGPPRPAVPVRPADGAEVRFAYDEQYLYVAIQCPQAPGVEYRPDDRPRPRDADLSRHDRVALRIDVDRDYSTALELTVDQRGWTHDAGWGNVHWNPNWYVAAASDESAWTVEAAVPLAELAAAPPAARHVWAVAARRTIPRVGYESWAGEPASDGTPAQFGLVIFE
jgi:hypothetical protein